METGDWIDLGLALMVFGLLLSLFWAFLINVRADGGFKGGIYRETPRKFRQAGILSGVAVWTFWVVKIGFAILFPLVALEFFTQPFVVVLSGVLGFFIPDFWLSSKVKKRQKLIRRGLSFYLDLVNSLLRSGVTLEKSFIVGVKQGFRDSHPLADEINLVSRELKLGRERETAFEKLAERTGVKELGIVAAAIRVAMRSGASIEETLEVQADLLRFRQQQEAIGRLNRSAAISVAPIFLCGMPIWLVIVFFPALVDLLETLQGLRTL